MNTFSDAFEKAITLEIDGKKVNVNQLTTRDYLPWLDELTTQRRAKEKELIPATTKPVEKFQMLRNIEVNEVTPDDLVPLIFTAQGTIKILELALTKAGVADPGRFIDGQPAKANERLAARVSGLLSATRFAMIYDVPKETKEGDGDSPKNPPAAEPTAALA